MKLMKVTFVENAGMLDNYIAPYEADMRSSNIDLFSKASGNGRDLSFGALAKTAGQILTPSSTRRHLAQIDNGWEADRIIFAMVVKTGERTLSEQYHYIVGHTDESKHTTRGTNVKFDKGMKLYFDSITQVHVTRASHGDDRIFQPKIQAHDEILNRASIIGHGRRRTNNNDRPVSLRPTDLFRRGSGDKAFGEFLRNSDVKTSNLLGHFSGQLKANNRANNSATSFLSRSVKSYMSAATDPGDSFIGDIDDEKVMNNAQHGVQETLLDDDPYMMALAHDTNIMESGYITFGELMDMNPDFDEDRNLPFHALTKSRRDKMARNQAGWKGTDVETIAATVISRTLPGLMINAMYSSVNDLILNTKARMGEDRVIAGRPWPFMDGLKVTTSLTYFESMVDQVLLNEVSKGGMFDIYAKIDANIDQDIKIWLTIDDGEEAYFEFPAWGSALLAPTLDTASGSLDLLSESIVDLSTTVARRHLDGNPSHVDKVGISTGLDLSGRKPERDERPGSSERNELPRGTRRDGGWSF